MPPRKRTSSVLNGDADVELNDIVVSDPSDALSLAEEAEAEAAEAEAIAAATRARPRPPTAQAGEGRHGSRRHVERHRVPPPRRRSRGSGHRTRPSGRG
jgi:hypothetical protein